MAETRIRGDSDKNKVRNGEKYRFIEFKQIDGRIYKKIARNILAIE
jgi:hypothetical protein